MKSKFHEKSRTHSKFLCYNRIMLKTKTKVKVATTGVLSIAAGVMAGALSIPHTSAITCEGGSTYDPTLVSPEDGTTVIGGCVANTTFQVNVVESLNVTLTEPTSGATGNINTFLRDEIDLSITSNNATGFTATMYADTSSDDKTSLVNTSSSSYTLPSLDDSCTRGDFNENHWGYSLDATTTMNNKTYNETSGGNGNSKYHKLPTSSAPDTVLTNTGATTSAVSRSIYFGTQANASIAAGTYSGTVVIGVVTGTVNDNNDSSNPVTPPDNPATNSDTTAGTATYNSSANRTVYYTTSTDSDAGTTTTETSVSAGNTVDSYSNPAGVTEHTTASIATGTPLATGLAVTSAVAATSGFIFFILAKRKKDDDDEEEEEQAN